MDEERDRHSCEGDRRQEVGRNYGSISRVMLANSRCLDVSEVSRASRRYEAEKGLRRQVYEKLNGKTRSQFRAVARFQSCVSRCLILVHSQGLEPGASVPAAGRGGVL